MFLTANARDVTPGKAKKDRWWLSPKWQQAGREISAQTCQEQAWSPAGPGRTPCWTCPCLGPPGEWDVQDVVWDVPGSCTQDPQDKDRRQNFVEPQALVSASHTVLLEEVPGFGCRGHFLPLRKFPRKCLPGTFPHSLENCLAPRAFCHLWLSSLPPE